MPPQDIQGRNGRESRDGQDGQDGRPALADRLIRGTGLTRYSRNMNELFSTLSTELANAVDAVAPSVVQLHGRRRQVAGVVVDTDLIVTLARAIDHGTVAVRCADGRTTEGTVVGQTQTGLAVVRVNESGLPVARPAIEPRPGELALAVGRTWSGNVFSMLAPVAVVGGPLRTGRRGELARVIRVGVPPHGALVGAALVTAGGGFLGLVTSAAIRGTTVVVPASVVVEAARQVATRGDVRQGFIGVASLPVALAPKQQAEGRDRGVLVTGVTPGGPAEAAGLLVGDVIVGFGGSPVRDHDELLELLRGDRVGQTVPVSVLRGATLETIAVTVQERGRV